MPASPTLAEAVRRLTHARLLTAGGLADFAGAAVASGLNLGALADFAARRFGDAVAVADPSGSLTFRELADRADQVAAILGKTHAVVRGSVVGLLCRNGLDFVVALFGASRLGARVLLLNPEMSAPQLQSIASRHEIEIVLGQADTLGLIGGAVPGVTVADLLATSAPDSGLPRVNGGELVVLTGGTTGPPKAAARAPKPANFLLLFAHLVTAIGLDRHRRAYVAVPLCHGYGIAAFLVALTLGRIVHLTPRFDLADALSLIARERIEVLAVVPVLLRRLVAAADADLSSVRCVSPAERPCPLPSP